MNVIHPFLDKICKAILHHPRHRFKLMETSERTSSCFLPRLLSVGNNQWKRREKRGGGHRLAKQRHLYAFMVSAEGFLFLYLFTQSLQHCPDSSRLSVMSVQGIQTHFTAWLTVRLKQKGQNLNGQHEVEATHKIFRTVSFQPLFHFGR